MVKSDCELVEIDEGCKTPRHDKYRIMVNSMCPPPTPRKKRIYVKQQSSPPKEGYFQPPDLEILFAIVPRRETRV
ncbi:hypothetical protein R3W88_015358 [Solanum pinnatisectum]|uniref:Uncharacterized protein n=1 Tax=Solanum pinnatisectum TaxID=50273 RepID=A0AAV9KXC8_9SOLN|nr:hypothetical protein R3W88_015358 [Solanum pinnatisectum]